MSDPSSQGWNKLLRGSFKRNVRKSHSAAENVDYMGTDCQEVEASDIEEGKQMECKDQNNALYCKVYCIEHYQSNHMIIEYLPCFFTW